MPWSRWVEWRSIGGLLQARLLGSGKPAQDNETCPRYLAEEDRVCCQSRGGGNIYLVVGHGWVVVIFAVVVIVVAGVGLPFVAWRVGRSAERRRPTSVHGLGPPPDAVDSWLIEHYGLPATKRWQVRDAVTSGCAVREESLRGAAHELAGCALRGELRVGRGLRVAATVTIVEGAGMIAAGGIVVLLAASAGVAAIAAGIVPAALGARFMVRGLAALRMAREGATRAYELNALAGRATAGAPDPGKLGAPRRAGKRFAGGAGEGARLLVCSGSPSLLPARLAARR